jgi:hypothetical protein
MSRKQGNVLRKEMIINRLDVAPQCGYLGNRLRGFSEKTGALGILIGLGEHLD